MQIGGLNAVIGANVAPFMRGMAQAKSAMAATGSSLASTGASAVAAGSMLTRGITAPVIALGALAIRSAGQYESALSQAGQASDATASQMKGMDRMALKLGADIRIPGASAKDAAESMTELAKGGLSASSAMGAARGTLQLAAAAGMENAESANIQVKALSAFGLEASRAGHVADVLAGGANKSTADMHQLSLGLAQAGQVAHSSGLSLDQTVASLGMLANAGLKGSDAGTSLKTMLQRIRAPLAKAKGEMDGMGISVYDAQGKMRPFSNIVGQFHTKLKGMTEQQRNASLETIFGSDAIRAAEIMFGKGSKALDSFTESVGKEGNAARAAAARTGPIQKAIDAVSSTASTASIMLGRVLAPAFIAVAKGVQRMLDWTMKLSGPAKTAVLTFIGVLALLGPALLVVGAAIALMTSPLTLIVLAIAAVAAGLVYLYQTNETFRAAVQAVIAAISDWWYQWQRGIGVLGQVKSALQSLAAFLRSAFASALAFVSALVRQWGPTVVAAFNTIVAWVKAKLPEALAVVRSVFTAIQAVFRAVMPVLLSIWNAVWPLLSTTVKAFATIVLAVVKATMDNIAAVIRVFSAVLRGDWGDAWNALKALVKTAITGVLNVVRTILTQLIPVALALAKLTGKAIWLGIKTVVSLLPGLLALLLSGLSGAINGAASWALGAASAIGRAIGAGVVSGIQGMVGAVVGAVKGLASSAIGAGLGALHINSPSKDFIEIGKSIPEGMLAGILQGWAPVPAGLADKLKKVIESARSRIDAMRPQVTGAFDRLGSDAMRAFDARTDQMLKKMGAKWDKAIGKLEGKLRAAQDSINAALEANLSALDSGRSVLTPAEQALAAMESGHAAGDRARSIADAQAALSKAVVEGEADGILSARRSLDDALYAQTLFDLQQAAAKERAAKDAAYETDRVAAESQAALMLAKEQAAYDASAAKQAAARASEELALTAQRELRKRHLEDQLADLGAALARHPEKWGSMHKRLMAMFASDFGKDYRTAGANLGAAFAQGLRESFGGVKGAVGQLASLVASYLKLHSPADKGPLSSLDSWWSGLAPTLIAGVDQGALNGFLGGVASPSGVGVGSARYAAPAAAQAPTIINVYVEGSVSSERDLVEAVRSGLVQRARGVPSLFGTT